MTNTSVANFGYLTITVTSGVKQVLHSATGDEPYVEGFIESITSAGVLNFDYNRVNVNVTTIGCICG